MAGDSLTTSPSKGVGHFKDLFSDRRLAGLSFTAAIARWQDSMMALSMITAAHSLGFSLTEASLAISALTITAGLSATTKGHLQDRFGVGRVVAVLSLGSALSYLLLILALLSGSIALVVAAAILLGLSRTNPGAYMQVTWMQVLKDKNLQAKSTSWEQFLTTIFQNTGPLVASALIALFMPMAALVFCGLVTSIAMFLWSRSSIHKSVEPSGKKATKLTFNIGRPISKVVSVVMMTSIIAGALQVVIVGGSTSPGTAAVLSAVFAGGAGLISLYSVLAKFPFLHKLNLALISGVVVLTPVIALAANTGPWMAIPALILGGVFYSCSTTAAPLIIKQEAPAHRLAEAFSWRVTLNFIGLSVGQLLAGLAIGAFGISGAGLALATLGFIFIIAAYLLVRPEPVATLSFGTLRPA